MIKKLLDMFKLTWKYLVFAAIITALLRYRFGAEFFDIFGLLVFGVLIVLGIWELSFKRRAPDYVYFSLIIIGMWGLLVDGWTSFNLIKSWIFGT